MRDPFFLAKLRAFILGLRPRKIRRRLLERRARRLASRRRQVASAPAPSVFVLEPLEGRVLLSADFVGAVDLLNQPILPHEAPAVSTLLDNGGPRAANGPALFTTLHPHDVVGPSFAGWHFDDRPGDAPKHHDHDGAQPTFTLTGPGKSEVVRDGDRWDVVLTGTDSRSIFTVNTHGADAKIDDIRVDGSLGQLRAGDADLYGDVSVRGTLHRLVLDDVKGGTVSAESVDEVRIKGDLRDATFLIGADLGADGQLGGSGAAADEFGPGHVGLFKVDGDVDDTTVRVGIDPVDGQFDNGNDKILGRAGNGIDKVEIGDSLSHDSLFQAGVLPHVVKVDHHRVDPSHDHRFITWTRGEHHLTLEAELAHDTGASATDGVTSDPTIEGTLEHSSPIRSFRAGFDDTALRDYVSIKGELGADGQFTLSRADLARINEELCGQPLDDGTHTLHLIATDAKGHTVRTDVTFTLDTRAPKRPTLDLAAASDSAPVGDHRTTFDVVTLVGKTSPGALVALLGTGAATTADQHGRFTFEDVSLDVGKNVFTVKATDLAGNKSFGSVRITRLAAPAAPTLAIGDAAVTEGNAGTTNAVFNVVLSAASTQTTTVNFATADGTATAGSDYTATGGTLTFAPGTTSRQITVPVLGDTLVEPTEAFSVNLSAPTNATLADAQGLGTITSDDAAATPTLAIGDATVAEGNAGTTNLLFTATLSAASAQPVTVDFGTSNGTALAPGDYATRTGTLTFAPGVTTQQITVPVVGDLVFETNETFLVNLTNAVNATIADGQGVGTITNDDNAPTLAINDVTVTEGNAGTTNAVFTVGLTGATALPATVDFATVDITATAGSDYTAAAGTLTFAPGTTSHQITVAVHGDTVAEPTEAFVVNLTGATNATIADNLGVGTIANDDAVAETPTLAINDVTVTEGNAGTTNAVFTVSLSAASAQAVTVGFATTDGTATAGSDYTAATGTLTFAPGTTTQQITVAVLGNLLFEANESFLVNLSNAVNATIVDAQGVGTITNDDNAPSLAINDVTVTEGNAGTTNAVFTVSLTGATALPATVDFATVDITATAGSDYTATAGTLTFAPGTTTQQITVAIHGDTVVEPTEAFVVNLTGATNATVADNLGVGTITNEDAAQTPTLAINDVTVVEGNAGTTNAVFTVTLSAASAQAVSVGFTTADGSATAGSDYSAASGTLTFAPGTTTQQITVTVLGDTLDETNETFFVNLLSAVNATIADGQGLGTITGDDSPPTLVIGDVTVAEGNAGITNAVFTVSLSGPSGRTVTVDFATADGTAAAPGDYAARTGTLTFAPGTTAQQITVAVAGDLVFEPTESFVVNLSNPVNATIADAQGAGTITNDDAQPTLAISDAAVTEGNAGTTNLVFTATLSGASSQTITAGFATANNTAAAPGDYASRAGSLTFAPGATSQLLTVTVVGDTIFEADETLLVSLASPVNATLADGQGVGTIVNDDAPPAFAINDVIVTEGDAGATNAVFTVTLTGATELAAVVSFATANGTATAGADYTGASGTLAFTPGTTAQQVTVAVLGDTVPEPTEAFFVNLSGVFNATIADGQGLGTILDNEASLGISDVTVAEGNTGTTNAVFTVTLSAASSLPVSVSFSTANGTATTADNDYTAVTGTVTFAPGTTAQQLTVTVTGDTRLEPTETFFVNLSNAVNAAITDAQAVGTITNDDAAPTLAITDVTVTEGNAGTTNAVFTVTLTGATVFPATVNFATADGTATAGVDYTAASGTLTFAPGTTSQQITVAVAGDTVFELTESFFVNLTAPASATIADGQGVGTITNDDTAPTLAINDVTIAEGNTGAANAIFTVTLTGASALPATVAFATANGTATAGSDYTAVSGTLTFAPGTTSQQITVPVLGDALSEPNETFFVNLTTPTNATIADAQGLGTITNDDGAPTLSITDVTVPEGNAGPTNAVFTVSLSTPSAQQVTVDFATANATAVTPSDYAGLAGTLTFAPGVTTQQITVAVAGDAFFELTETFEVNLTNAVNATIADAQGIGTITNDDAAPALAINDVTLAEGNTGTTNAVFMVTLTGATALPVTVNFTTVDGTATAGSDYMATSGTLTFAAGITAQQITVAVLGDVVTETSETFLVNLSGATNATISDFQGIGNIVDDEGAPILSIGDVTIAEGDTGTKNAFFMVTLAGQSSLPAVVNFATANGTATAGADYTATTGTLTVSPGIGMALITVPVIGDLLDEANETFFINLSGATNAVIGDPQGVGTITDDDPAPALSISNITVNEGNTGTTNAVFTVSLSTPSGQTVTVDYATADTTAVAPGDYTAQTGTLTFAAGVTTQQITVAVTGDTVLEVTEAFQVNLTNPVNATLADGQGLGTIVNDDNLPTLAINDVTVIEGNSGTTNAIFTVTLTGATALPAVVTFNTANGTATAGSDYTGTSSALTFAPGTTTQLITVAVLGDTIAEPTETFTVILSGPTSASITDGQGTGTITDDDAVPTISISDVTVTEGNAGTTNAVFTVSLSISSGQPVTVNFATTDGTATAPADYAAQAGTLTFAPGVTTQQITVAVAGELVFETNETFLVNLSNPVNGTIGDGQGVGTITNDDTAPALAINDVTVTEGNTGTTNAIFTVTLTGATALPATVAFTTANGNALAGADYTTATGSITFAAGSTAQLVTVAVLGDTLDEANETFLVNLSGPSNATIIDGQGVGTITDDDPAPSITIVDEVTVTEGNTGTTSAVFTVSLSTASGQVVTANFATTNGTAVAPGDYAAQAGTVTFAPGTTTQLITVAVVGDTVFEANETFLVELTNAANATIDNALGLGTITNDDAAPTLTISDVTVTEGDTGSTNAVFTVTLSGATALPATVAFTTANGTATAGTDYTTTAATLTFAVGTTSQQITVPVLGDTLNEPTETFFVNLGTTTNATVADGQGLGTILDNDGAPTLAINDVTVTEGNAATTNAVFTVSLTTPSAQQITVDFATANGSATSGVDYTAAASTLTFAPGVTTQQITVAVTGDLVFEGNETFTVNLSNALNAIIADGQGLGTITNDDTAPALAINDVTVAEGTGGTTNAVFTVTLTGPTALPATVSFTTADQTATAGTDYTTTAGTLTFAPGTTTQQITVAVNPDAVFESAETFVVNLTGPINATITDPQGLGTITNDDTAPTLAINDVTLAEGGAGATTNAVFTVTLTGATALPATVNFATADGTATAGSDYTAVSGVLTFAPGITTQLITVPVLGDTLSEPNETFFVNLTTPTNATLTDGQGLGTITNDDGVSALSINDVTVTEGNAATTNAVFTVSLSTTSAQQITVEFATVNGTATAGTDYTAAAGTLTFAPGVTTQQITVAVTGDLVFEANETFLVNLANAVNASIADGQGAGTITNDDTAPTLAISDVTLAEGNSGTTNAVFTVTLTGPTALPATVDFTTANNTATAGSDYTTAAGTVTFAPGTTTQQITVGVTGDTVFEATESFFVNLANAGNATITDPQGVGTITNDDTAPALTINDVTVAEGGAGATTNAVFTVTLTGATALPATVNFATADGTATAGSDYTATNGTLTFAPGVTSQQITVAVTGDTLNEANETFFVNLSGATNATITDPQGLGTINNDDGAPALSINDVAVTEGVTTVTNAVFTVSLATPSAQQITVDFATANNSAVAPGDYTATNGTLTFAPGVTTQQITVPVIGDIVFEANETFLVNLANAINATIADNQGIGTITNDDQAPSLAISDVTVTEGNAATTNAVFTVTRTGPTELAATVNFTTANVTATAPSDYATTSGTLTFAPGTTSQQITVPVVGDTTFEAAETFQVNLSVANNATITDGQGIGTITNDDTAPSLSINDVTVIEGNTGTTNAVFTVTLTGATALPATVNFATANDTATAGSDHTATSGTLTFAVGTTAQQVTVAVLTDALNEPDETFFVNLSGQTNAIIADGQGVGTITNDDGAPTLVINDVTVAEGNTGTINAVFTVSLTAASAQQITVGFTTTDVSAVAPGDYATQTGTVTFAPDVTTQAITVAVVGDATFELTETFQVNLNNPVNAAISDGQGIGTITSDDTAPTLTINDVAVTEGDAGTTNAVFTVTLNGATALPATVNFATGNGTAVAGADYVATSSTLTFAPGTTSQPITVAVQGDLLDEAAENFFVNLSGASNATITDPQGQGTINDNDPTPTLVINDVTVAEGNAGTTNAVFTVTLSAPSGQLVTVAFATANETAIAPGDYATQSGTLTFGPGATTQQITVAVVGDTAFENNESFVVNLTTATNAIVDDTQGTGVVTNDDPASTLAINDVTVTEGNTGTTNAVFTVTLTGATSLPTTVNFATADGTATAGSDYTAANGTLTFAPGTTSQLITVAVTTDLLNEPNETFFVNLTGAVNATVTDPQGLGTITNDDGPPALSINDVAVAEGNTGTTNAVFTVSLSTPSALPVTVDFATAPGTATSPADFAAQTGTLTFAAGTTTQLITVAVVGEAIFEANETFVVNLTNPTNATLGDGQGQGTINNDDPAPALTINDVTVTEGNAGTTNAIFTVTLSGTTALPATVNFITANGSATAGADYTGTAGTLTFAPGTTTQQVTVAVLGDLLDEVDETFFVNLNTPGNATITDAQGIGTITDDDVAPTLTINDVTLTEGNVTTNAVFTVSLSSATGQTVTVDFTTVNGTAVAPGDFTAQSGTLTFAPGLTTQQITVAVAGDVIFEGAEAFQVTLSNPINATITDGTGVGTINNDDAAPVLAINDVTVTEGDASSVNAVFTVTLTGPTALTATVNFTTANGTATAGTDYTGTSGTLTFVPGTTTQPITVAVLGDTIFEGPETFLVNLATPVNATIGDGQGTGTITDNDATPSLTIGDAAVVEGNAATTNAVFTVTLSAASTQQVTVGFATANGTAVAPGDYATQTGTLTFAPGVTTQQITVAVVGDVTFETTETFQVTLNTPVNATILDGQATGTIINDDPAPTLAINDVLVTEGNAGTTNAVFTVTLTGATALPATVNFATANGSALAGSDYTNTSGTLTFDPGVTTQLVTVPVLGDVVAEPIETFVVNLSGALNATILNGQGTGTINDNDAVAALSINDVAVAEGDSGPSNAVFTVTLSAPSGQAVTVAFATANGTAVAPGDYTAQTGTLTFAPGVTTQQITVAVLGDTSDEADETFFVNLSNATNASIQDAQGVGIITDTDTMPTLRINDVSVREGDTGTTNLVFTLNLSAPSGLTVSVSFTTTDSSATSPSDFTAQTGTITFAPGTTSQTLTIAVVGDGAVEPIEQFTVNLSQPINATLDNTQAVGRILNDDTRALAISDATVIEGNTGTTNAVFTVRLSEVSAVPVTAAFVTGDNTAISLNDYVAQVGSLTFAPGTTVQTITVAVQGDEAVELTELFSVTLSQPVNAVIDNVTGTGRILSDDLRTVSVNDVTIPEGSTGATNLVFTVTLSQATAAPVTVNFATSDSSAVEPSDYTARVGTLTFAPGTTVHTITVPVVGDSEVESTEQFFITLSQPVNAGLGNATGTARLLNDDTRSLVINDLTVMEGDTGTTNALFTVTMSEAATAPVTVNFATSPSSAQAPTDYQSVSGTLTFAPGITTQTITVPIVGDSAPESNETFTIALNGAVNAVINTTSATGRILDNDTRTVSIHDATTNEGDTGTTNLVFAVTLSQAASAPVTVNFVTNDSSAVSPADYTAVAGTLTFAAGVTSQNITVAVVGDVVDESDEVFTVTLSQPVNASLDNSSGVGRILDNEGAPALPRIVIDDVAVIEGNSGTTNAVFRLTLSAPSASAVTVNFATANSSAIAPGDYTTASGTLTFAADTTTQTLTVAVVGEAAPENNEVFNVNLSGPTNATIADTVGQAIIYDDDTTRVLAIDDVGVVEGNSGTTNAVFRVTLSQPSPAPVTVNFATANSSAIAPGDYATTNGTLTFAAGTTVQTVTVAVVGETADENNEAFSVTLSGAVNAAIADTTGSATIFDDDGARQIAISDVFVREGDSGTTNAIFTVTLTHAAPTAVTVNFATANSGAIAPGDYTATTGTLTFAAGSTVQTITVPVVGDAGVEPNETFSVNLTSPVNAALFDGQGIATIQDDDDREIVINDVTIAEGHSGTTNAIFVVTLSQAAPVPVTVNFATGNNSAVAPGDYTATTGTLTFAAGSTVQTITVPVVGDGTVESNEFYTVTLSSAVNATLTDPTAFGTIFDDDATRQIVIDDVVVLEGDSGTTNAIFTLTLSQAVPVPVTVNFATSNNSAVAPGDYTATSGTVTFAAGTTVQTVTVAVAGEATVENNENFFVSLTAPVNAALADTSALATIIDDDAARQIAINDVSVVEGHTGTTNAVFTLTLSEPVPAAVTVNFTTANSSAIAPGDYTAATGTVTFAAGTTAQTLTIAVVGEGLAESNEIFAVNLSGAVNATILDNQGLATIVDDDTARQVSINDAAVAEGNAGTTNLVFTVTLSQAVPVPVTVNFATANSGAVAPGDYAATSGTLTFAANTTQQQITVAVVGDVTIEPSEIFVVNLTAPVNATLGDSQAVGTIIDDDGTRTLSIGDVAVVEGDAGTTNAVLAVNLSTSTSQTVTVNFATGNNTATAPGDYTTTAGTLTFAPGVTVQQIPVPVVADLVGEPTELFVVNLSSPTNATISDSQGVVTIQDNDVQALAVLDIDDVTIVEGDSGNTNAVFTVRLGGASSQTVTVNFVTSDSTAIAPSDYLTQTGILTFAPGVTAQSIAVPIVGDSTPETTEFLVVTLSTPVNATIDDGQAFGRILDNDTRTISINDVTVIEGDSGTSNAVFTLTLSQAAQAPVSVDFSTSNSSAVAPSDYLAQTGIATFAAGTTTQTLTVPIVGDADPESSELFVVTLSSPVNASIDNVQGIGRILDNDIRTVSINDTIVTEGDSGTTDAVFTVTLSQAAPEPVTVDFNTINSSAAAPSDYTDTTGTVTFAPGSTIQTLTVPVVGDEVDEGTEQFFVSLSGAVNATIDNSFAVGRILDDESRTISINDVTVVEPDTGTVNAVFTVTLSEPAVGTVSVDFATRPSSAGAPADFTAQTGTLNFAPGVTTQTITVAVVGDDVEAEGLEQFFIDLSAPVNTTIDNGTGTGRILDGDRRTLSIDDVTITEPDAGTANAVFTVTLSQAAASPVTVQFATRPSSAGSPADFTAQTGVLTFAPGVTTQTITVAVVGDDAEAEALEQFFVDLSSAVNASIDNVTGTGRILDGDRRTLSINDATVVEGNAGTTNLVFTVTLSEAAASPVTVAFATRPSSAGSPADFTAQTGTLTFTAGVTAQTITVAVVGETTDETLEQFFVDLSAPINASLDNITGTGRILDDDGPAAPPVLAIDDATVIEGDSGTTNLVFTVHMSAVSATPVTVGFATSTSSATAPSDFAMAAGTLTFAPGTTAQNVTVAVVGDVAVESDEFLTVTLSNPTGATLGDGSASATIFDDDTTRQLVINDATVAEGNSGTTNLVFTVFLSEAAPSPVTVEFVTSASSAVSPSDFAQTSGTLTFAPGATLQTITVPIVGEQLSESDEFLTVTLSNPTGAAIGDGSAFGTIFDDDATRQLVINDATVAEGNTGTTNLVFTIILSQAAPLPVTVGFATSNNSALAPGDYTHTSGTVTFAPGTTLQTVTVAVIGEQLSESDEFLFVTLSNPAGATLGDGSGTGTIFDDDASRLLLINDMSVVEGDSGTTSLVFTVTMSDAAPLPVTVEFATSSNSATAPDDFAAARGTLTFAPGSTAQTITVAVAGDSTIEGDENFGVTLSNATNAVISDATATGTIYDDDAPRVLVIDDATVVEGDSGSRNLVFTVTMSKTASSPVTVQFQTSNGSAVVGSDYTSTFGILTFAPGTTTQTITVAVLGDATPEGDESLVVTLANADNATISDTVGFGTIYDDDGNRQLVIDDASIMEGDGGTRNLVFRVTMSSASSAPVTVAFQTNNGSAVAPGDYAAQSGILTFAPGTTAMTITVPIVGDQLSETAESFSVVLSDPTNAFIGDTFGQGTIFEDDNRA